MTGGTASKVRVVLRNPVLKSDQVDYLIEPNDSLIAQEWIVALKDILQSENQLEKNFCFMGFPFSARNLNYLCTELNTAIYKINIFNRTKIWQGAGLAPYVIEEYFTPDVVRFGDEYTIGYTSEALGLGIKHSVMNTLHNHFERLQGTVWSLSAYYKLADYETKYAIRQLNNLCHEMESLCISQRKIVTSPQWVRPSQITTFLDAPRLDLKCEHRKGFVTNGYNRQFGHVYMHWTQIGKTLFEVFRDEGAPKLTDTVCEAITELKYYSGEFDVEWANDIVLGGEAPWHDKQQNAFRAWLIDNGKDPADPKLSLGYLPLGKVLLRESFGTIHVPSIWQIISNHLDIYKIEIDDVSRTFDYCWSDLDYKQRQVDSMRPGYDYSSRK
jgi:hypothetical protein